MDETVAITVRPSPLIFQGHPMATADTSVYGWTNHASSFTYVLPKTC